MQSTYKCENLRKWCLYFCTRCLNCPKRDSNTCETRAFCMRVEVYDWTRIHTHIHVGFMSPVHTSPSTFCPAAWETVSPAQCGQNRSSVSPLPATVLQHTCNTTSQWPWFISDTKLSVLSIVLRVTELSSCGPTHTQSGTNDSFNQLTCSTAKVLWRLFSFKYCSISRMTLQNKREEEVTLAHKKQCHKVGGRYTSCSLLALYLQRHLDVYSVHIRISSYTFVRILLCNAVYLRIALYIVVYLCILPYNSVYSFRVYPVFGGNVSAHVQ